MTWGEERIGDYFEVKHGFAFKGEFFSDSGKYIVVTPGSFFESGGFKDRGDKSKYYTATPPEEFVLGCDDLIIAMTEQAEGLLGASALVPADDLYLHNQRIGLVVDLDTTRLDKHFLYYLLNTRPVRDQIRATATGTKVKHTAPKRIRAVNVPLPPLEAQAKIARVLSAYDDLIENNNRRMVLLEEAIHLLYREWFVSHRFPGHQRIQVVDGVPEGWRLGVASDCLSVLSGGTPKTKVESYWDGEIPFFTPKDAPGGIFVWSTEKTVTDEGLRNCNSRLFPRETLFITARGTVGKLALAQRPMAMNQSCYALEPRAPYDGVFLYCAMQEVVRHLRKAATGGVFDTIIVQTFDRTPMLVVPGNLAQQFSDAVRPLVQQADALTSMNRQLQEARDLLLPRLMNGSIAV